jgi:hypothetical protein
MTAAAMMSLVAPGTRATPSTPTPCCADWSPHPTCAIIEAEERGLADVLSLEFEPAPQALSSVLTYCDITTSSAANTCRRKSGSPRYSSATAPGTW